MMHVKATPIVHAASFEVAVGDGEAEWVDEVQATARYGAQAADVACVLGNFRLKKDDVKHKPACAVSARRWQEQPRRGMGQLSGRRAGSPKNSEKKKEFVARTCAWRATMTSQCIRVGVHM